MNTCYNCGQQFDTRFTIPLRHDGTNDKCVKKQMCILCLYDSIVSKKRIKCLEHGIYCDNFIRNNLSAITDLYAFNVEMNLAECRTYITSLEMEIESMKKYVKNTTKELTNIYKRKL